MTENRRTLLVASLTPFGLFVLLGIAVNHGWLGTGELDGASAGIRAWAVDRPWLEDTLLLVESAFAMQGLTVLTVVLAGWLLLRRQLRAALLVLVVMWSVRELTGPAKDLFGRDRPVWQDSDALHHAGSYPSGHAAGIVTLGGLVIVLAIIGTRSRAHLRPVAAVVSLAVLVVFADRLLLGRHYPTDLLGGALLGTGLVLLGTALVLPLAGAPRETAQDAEAATADDTEKDLAAR